MIYRLIRRDRATVATFVAEHEVELPTLVVREVGRKLETGKK